MIQSHTGTQQWQSFELRMRQRRLERCLLRGSAAIEAGVLEDAREALEEARVLDPDAPGVVALAEQLAAAERLPAAPAIADTAGGSPRRSRWLAAAAATALVTMSGAGGWWWMSSSPRRGATHASAAPAALGSGTATATERPAPAAPDISDSASMPSVRVAETSITAPVVTVEELAPEPRVTGTAGRAAPRDAPPATLASTAATAPRPEERADPAPAIPPPARLPAAEALLPSAPPATSRIDAAPGLPEPPPDVPRTEPEVRNTSPALRAGLTEPPGAVATPVAVAAPPAPSEEQAVRAVLSRYEAAYSRLDAAAAKAVWPGVDQRALANAFQALSSQAISLARCDVRVTGPTAQAQCSGVARWTPKVGGGTQSSSRQWRFDLRNTGGGWVIAQAVAR